MSGYVAANERINGKFIPVHAIKAYRGCNVMAPPTLISALHGCEWSRSRPGHFTFGKELRYLSNTCTGLAGTQVLGGTGTFLLVGGIRTPYRLLRNLVTKLTELSQLQNIEWLLSGEFGSAWKEIFMV